MTGGKVALAVFSFVALLFQLFPIDVRAQSWPTPIAHVLCHAQKNEAVVYFTTEDSPDSWVRRRDEAYRQATGRDLDLSQFRFDVDTCTLPNGWEIKASVDYEWGSHVRCSPNMPYAVWINKRRINGGVTSCHYNDAGIQNEVAALLIDETGVQSCYVAWADDGTSFNFESVEVGYRCTSLGAPLSVGERDYRSYPENNQPPYPAGLIATYRKDESLCRPAVANDEAGEEIFPRDIKRHLVWRPGREGWEKLKWGTAHSYAEDSDITISRAIFDADNNGRKSVVYDIRITLNQVNLGRISDENFWLIFEQGAVTQAQEKIVKDLLRTYLNAKTSEVLISELYRSKSFRIIGARQLPDNRNVANFQAVWIGPTLYIVATSIADMALPDYYYGHYHQMDILHRENFTVLYKPLPGGRFETICTYDQFGPPFSPYR